jgi:hypothetical protein
MSCLSSRPRSGGGEAGGGIVTDTPADFDDLVRLFGYLGRGPRELRIFEVYRRRMMDAW